MFEIYLTINPRFNQFSTIIPNGYLSFNIRSEKYPLAKQSCSSRFEIHLIANPKFKYAKWLTPVITSFQIYVTANPNFNTSFQIYLRVN